MTTLQKLQDALPKLEQKIRIITGEKVSLFIKANEEKRSYHIMSQSLTHALSGISKAIFKEINLDFWGGQDQEGDHVIYFCPKISYTHWSGGSNVTDYIWGFLVFDKTSGSWDFENSNLIYKQ